MTQRGFAVLRDRRSWLGAWAGLEQAADGTLVLARVPAPAGGGPVDLPGPYDPAPSGLAIGGAGTTYLTVPDAARIVALDGCGSRREAPGAGPPGDGLGELRSPRALQPACGMLLVADAGNGRVIAYRLPELTPARIFGPPLLVTPSGLAVDRADRVYVLDPALGRVLRFTAWGVPDGAWLASAAGAPADPAFLAMAGDVLYVADSAGSVRRYSETGALLGGLPGGPVAVRALAAGDGRLYAADGATGEIWVLDLLAGHWVGTVAHFRGPVAAMAADAGGLVVKPGGGDRLIRLVAGAGCVAGGTLRAGPFDAGLDGGWGRVRAAIDTPPGSDAALTLGTADRGDDGADPDAPEEWVEAAALDLLAPRAIEEPEPERARRAPRPRRYLWLSVTLSSTDRRSSPRIEQVMAETAGPGYLAALPEIYRLADEQGFLADWLELVRSVLGDLDADVDAVARRVDPAVAPDSELARLTTWVGWSAPAVAGPDALRELLARLPALARRRGTPAGLRELLRVETGVDATVVEDFTQRRIWQLGRRTSVLGFDTRLPWSDPDGMVVADDQAAEPARGIVVGRSGPLPDDDWATPLFTATAHRFRVVVPGRDARASARVQAVLDREAPPYTEHHLCVVQPRMRVGVQATVGLDAVVAAPPAPQQLSTAVLGATTRLGATHTDPGVLRVGTTHVTVTVAEGAGCP